MSIYTTAVKYDPSWEVPSLDEIDAVAVSSSFCKKLAEFHTGLRYVNITPTYKDPETGGNMRCSPQKFSVKGAGKNKIPAISVDELARIITCFAQEQCNDLDRGEVAYECHFKGASDEHGGEFYNRGSFRLQPEPEPPEPEKKKSPSPSDTSSTLIVSGSRGVQGPSRRFLGEPGTPAPSPMESEAIQAIRVATDSQKSLLNDAQSMMDQLKISFTGAIEAMNNSWKDVLDKQSTVIDKLIEENEHQRKETTNANNRLIKMTEQYASQTDGEKKILQYAMNMFLEGMKTQWGAMSREMSWERQIMYQQFDALAQQYKKDNRQEWLKDYSPLLLAVSGQVMERFGAKGQGQVLQQIAAGIAQEDEEEEDSVPVQARPTRPAPPHKPVVKNTTVMGVPPGADPEKHLEQNPVASIFQLFGSTVQENSKQVESIQKILGDKFSMFHQAMSATDDAQARAYGVRLMTALTQNGLRSKLEAVLNDEQRELFNDIHKQLFGAVTTASIPSDAASIAEVRTFAKQNYGLTFPRSAKKEEMLNAIKERASN